MTYIDSWLPRLITSQRLLELFSLLGLLCSLGVFVLLGCG
jgi:hypothetical protein